MFDKLWKRTPVPKVPEPRFATENIALSDDPSAVLQAVDDKFYRYIMGVDSLRAGPMSDLEAIAIKQIDALTKQEKVANLIPRLPKIVPQLMQHLRTDDYNGKAATGLISSDPVLTVEVIRLVNSPYFRSRVKVKNLHQAVVKLGQSGLREVVMAVAMKPIMQFEHGFFHQQAAKLTLEQAMKTAMACRALAVGAGVDPFEAYVAGLMHNPGAIMILQQLNRLPEVLEVPESQDFQQRSVKLSAQLSLLIAHHWKLSDDVITALDEHLGAPQQRPKSALGQVLELGICLAQMHMLAVVDRYEDVEEDVELLSQQPGGRSSAIAYVLLNVDEVGYSKKPLH